MIALQIKKLAKCQQLFSHGFATDSSTLEILLDLDRSRSASTRRLQSNSSLKRASVYEVATSIFGVDGMQQRHVMRQALNRASETGQGDRRRSSAGGAESHEDVKRRRSSVRPAARRMSGGMRAVHALNRMQTCSFVNPALLAPASALASAGADYAQRESVLPPVRPSQLPSLTPSEVLAHRVLQHSHSDQLRSGRMQHTLDGLSGSSAADAQLETAQLRGLVAECCSMVHNTASEVNAIKSAVLYSQFQIANQAAALERQRMLDARRGPPPH